MKDDRFYLIHIGECITRIEDYTKGGEDHFFADTKTQDAVLRNLQVLSESTQRLSEDLRHRYDDVDWQAIAGFRNILVHNYLGVNLKRIWEIVTVYLPALKVSVDKMLRGEKSSEA